MNELSYFPVNLKEPTRATNGDFVIFERNNCSMHRKELQAKNSIKWETHDNKDQFVYLIQGNMSITYYNNGDAAQRITQDLIKHQIFKIPKGFDHQIFADETSVFLSFYVE